MTADAEAVEAVSEVLARASGRGVAVEPAFELVDEGLAARVDPTRPAIVRAYVRATEAGQAEERARRELGHLQAFELRPIGELGVRPIPDADWTTAWRAGFPLLRIGRRLVVRPTWRRHRPAPDEVVLALDPGAAFGTGLHPTTRLCLLGLEAWADSDLLTGSRVLDLGTGSGILAIAAARLGATSIVALDIDPIAVEAAAANARRNRVARRVHARHGSLPSPGGPFDLVLANLVASLLVGLAAELREALRPGNGPEGRGGRVLASGIFLDREPEVRRAFAAAGIHVRGRRAEGDWVSLEAERIG